MSKEETRLMDNKMLELEYDTQHPEEMAKAADDDDAVVRDEFDDNFITIQGLFVESPMDNIIIDEDEINQFTSLTKSTLLQKQFIPYKYEPDFFIKAAEDLFDNVKEVDDDDCTFKGDLLMEIEGIKVRYRRNCKLLECTWTASPKLDLITDAIGLLALQLCNLNLLIL